MHIQSRMGDVDYSINAGIAQGKVSGGMVWFLLCILSGPLARSAS